MTALARPAAAAVLRSPRAWVVSTFWVAVAVVAALVARGGHWIHGADLVLGLHGALVLPLLSYAVVGAALEWGPFARTTSQLVGLGASPARAAAATLMIAALACAFLGAVTAAMVALLAHGTGDPPVSWDVVTSAYVGALGGCAYAAWFGFGATFGKRGGGRTLFLLVDWALGSSGGAFAVASPRAHLRNLLGGLPPLGLSERSSAACLVALTLACLLLVAWRANDGRLN